MFGLYSGYSPLSLADLVIPGVVLGAGKKNILEKPIPSNPLRRMQRNKNGCNFFLAKLVFFSQLPWKSWLDPVSHLLLSCCCCFFV